MADYGIDINVNMGGSQGNFQTLIDSMNQLNANFQKVGDSATTAGNRSKQSFADSMNIINKYGGSVQAAAANIDKWKAKIEELNRLNNTGSINQTKYNSQINAAAAAIKRIETATRQYNSVLGQTVSTAKSAQSSFAGLTKTLNTLAGVMGTSFSLFGAFMVLKNAIKTIADFDLAQKKLQSVLGETAEGMKELSKSAVDLGRNSIFGAKGVSELQIELAKMGFTKNEVMAMQAAINDLAIATQEDLASSAETVANILKTFNLSATETRDIVNVMGRAFNDSALGLANFREGIKYVAPVANQAGLSFRETVAAMELLANAGLKGSLTGTALNNVLKAMMDSNSKLAKSMGGTVSGWEGFVSVLQRAKTEGWNMQDIFGLITQRATGAFSVLMDGVGTLEEMNQKLEDVSFTISDMTAVQLDSITYKAKLAKEAWNGFILAMDKGDNALSNVMKRSLDGVANLLSLLSGGTAELREEINKMGIELSRALANPNLDENTRIALEGQKKIIDQASKEIDGMSNYQLSRFTQFYIGTLNKANEAINQAVTESADKIVESYNIVGKSAEDFESKQNQALIDISAQMKVLGENTKLTAFQYKVLQEAFSKIDKMSFERTSPLVTDSDSERLKAIRDRFKTEIELLKLSKSYRDEVIQSYMNEYKQLFDLEENQYKLKIDLANKEFEQAIALGEKRVDAERILKLKLQQIELEHSNNLNKIYDDTLKKALAEQEKLLKGSFEIRKKYSKDYVEDWKKRMQDLDDFMKKFAQDNPFLNLLFGQQIEENLFSGIISEDDVNNFTETFNDLAGVVGDNLEGIVNSWVDATDKIVDQLNRQVDETQSAIAVEAELMAAGYANNLTAERNKLERLKEMRKEALEDQKKAQRAQLAMDSAQQVSGLITSAVKVFQAESGKGILGIALAIAGIATIFGMMAKYRAMAKQQSIERFAEGGWIGGRSHREGGTHIEAEKGEFVINKRSAFKHKELIEAINGDNKYELNKIYLNNLKNQVLTASVSLDDSKYLKGIYEKMNEKGRTVEYANGYRIEKNGIIITKVRLN